MGINREMVKMVSLTGTFSLYTKEVSCSRLGSLFIHTLVGQPSLVGRGGARGDCIIYLKIAKKYKRFCLLFDVFRCQICR